MIVSVPRCALAGLAPPSDTPHRLAPIHNVHPLLKSSSKSRYAGSGSPGIGKGYENLKPLNDSESTLAAITRTPLST